MIGEERRAFADTLEAVGPEAPTLAGTWTAGDLAAHVVSLDRFGGVPTFLGRSIVARRALRLNDVAGRFADGPIRAVKRRGFPWALDRLRRDPPGLLVRPSVAAVGLFEVVVHHEDVRRANDLPRRSMASEPLDPVIGWLLRYHRSRVPDVTLRVGGQSAGQGPTVTIAGEPLESVVWLAGRRQAADVTLDGPPDAVARLLEQALRV